MNDTTASYANLRIRPELAKSNVKGHDDFKINRLGSSIHIHPNIVREGIEFQIEADYTFSNSDLKNVKDVSEYYVKQTASLKRDENNQIQPLLIENDDFTLKIEVGIN